MRNVSITPTLHPGGGAGVVAGVEQGEMAATMDAISASTSFQSVTVRLYFEGGFDAIWVAHVYGEDVNALRLHLHRRTSVVSLVLPEDLPAMCDPAVDLISVHVRGKTSSQRVSIRNIPRADAFKRRNAQDLAQQARRILRACSPIAREMQMMGQLSVEDVRLVIDTQRPKQAPEMSIVFRTAQCDSKGEPVTGKRPRLPGENGQGFPEN
eukprot:gene7577-biopygen4583